MVTITDAALDGSRGTDEQGVKTRIINFPGPASPQRHGPAATASHGLTCTPNPEEPVNHKIN
ncbi:hypothetical protein WIS52_15885 [Pseudonocardia nematodicida]|uniref:Uncharacterized protein n=1 Tax=Pseudonocardia nematodicida TaxID=1206997 RepID=A0ABV1KBV4_9PSEU